MKKTSEKSGSLLSVDARRLGSTFRLDGAGARRGRVPVDGNYAQPVFVDDATHGWGGQLRFGPRLDLKISTFDSEVVAGGVAFYDANGNPTEELSWTLRTTAGDPLGPSTQCVFTPGHWSHELLKSTRPNQSCW